MLARLKRRADAARGALWPGNNIGYFGPYESRPARHVPRRPQRLVRRRARRRSASRPTATSRAARRSRRSDYVGGNVRDALAARHLGARARRCASRAIAPSDDLWGYCRDLLLRRRVPRAAALDDARALRQAGQQPLLPPPRARAAARGRARAPRAQSSRAGRRRSTTGGSRSSSRRGRRRSERGTSHDGSGGGRP